MGTLNLSQSRLVYNPQLQNAEMTKKLFSVRQEQFALLLNGILKEKPNSIPQHYLLIGQRGMGKTTILKRMEVELHEKQYQQQFVPLLFREEQRGVQDLSEFWLNSLDALANSLEYEQYPAETVAEIDNTVKKLLKETSDTISSEAYKYLMKTCQDLHRRPVLLVDNIDKVFSRLDINSKNKAEQWALRKLLSENGAPIVIGCGVTTTDHVAEYEMPFYDFFRTQYLRKLNYEEFVNLLKNLAAKTNSDASIFTNIQNASRQKALLELTGGNPRVTVILFDQIARGFSASINDDLNVLADALTPLYEAKLDKLSDQQQIIIDAIALNWDAISLRKLAIATRMKNNQLSPQLKRLIDDGWVETTPAYKNKGNAYFISERFFNIYYIIRNSSRRDKDKIYCLSKFLECFYGKEYLEDISDTLLNQEISSSEQMRLHLAMANVKSLKPSIKEKMQQKTIDTFMKDEKLRKEFDVSEVSILRDGQLQYGKDNYEKLKPDEAGAYFNMGSAYYYKQQYEKAIECYKKAIELNPDNTKAYNNMGVAYDEMNDFENAALTYEEALLKNPKNLSAKFHLIFLYRDILNRMNRAMELFNSIDEQEIQKEEDKNFACRYYLNKAGFELYNQNQGLAKEYLLQAFDVLEKNEAIASIANDGWWMRFGFAVDKLGYDSWLLSILEERGYDIVLSPYYTAIKAIEIEKEDSRNGKKNTELYLSNRAIEISEPARKIMERIRKYKR